MRLLCMQQGGICCSNPYLFLFRYLVLLIYDVYFASFEQYYRLHSVTLDSQHTDNATLAMTSSSALELEHYILLTSIINTKVLSLGQSPLHLIQHAPISHAHLPIYLLPLLDPTSRSFNRHNQITSLGPYLSHPLHLSWLYDLSPSNDACYRYS
ncbi:hypothetical protein BT63DRAFT_422438 [Microthyrium microscopicum]|uniref:Uncharacterized protein n=1 Tax=Microthyrium microscopicum TaxID=703497 RepID=A0A6A6UJG8_9PEZI|nr:hypothetical protein BT63DRAFT_422438 [Microthyrium microscopicum]